MVQRKRTAPAKVQDKKPVDKIMRVDELTPYLKNARTHSPAQVQKLARSISEFGFTNPVLVWKGQIVAGHGRVMAAKTLGLKEVPVRVLDYLSDAQRRALVLADNKLAEEAGWDEELLAQELSDLSEMDIDISLTGFDAPEIKDAMDALNIEGEDDAPALPQKPVSKLGDVWVLGKHRLLCGDARNSTDFANLLLGSTPDLVFTDPPYGVDYIGGRSAVVKAKPNLKKIKNDTLEGEALGKLIELTLQCGAAEMYFCLSTMLEYPFLQVMDALQRKIDASITWNKGNAGLGFMKYRRQTERIIYLRNKKYKKTENSDVDLWDIAREHGKEYIHGNQKPVALAQRAILNSSEEGQMVLDTFGGSGSTLIACEKNNRVCRMMELDPLYVDVIVMRWQNFTGQKAVLEGSGKGFDAMLQKITRQK